ncbi:LysM peptidoglycan-binding domain-containing protein [Paenibacillus agilis]|uniref:LysM peptidoglycan-binding domain-containing protein n=1 Tax=Paenibacillus agilis TaxID=3020863 RepID=A0A559IWE9_9BACL|nr:LysM peptidoglycan-binding domain-containing protein [Paenibacillus agilis]TVX91959.1 LysM peptidoglycan-binding domain-containing protein [Paenibacillus agilis]
MIDYVVRPGDSLSLIANRFGISVVRLALVNGLGPNAIIYPGQVIKIPVGPDVPVPIQPGYPPSPPPPIPPAPPMNYYELERRVSLLEAQVRRLQREVNQLQGQPTPY